MRRRVRGKRGTHGQVCCSSCELWPTQGCWCSHLQSPNLFRCSIEKVKAMDLVRCFSGWQVSSLWPRWPLRAFPAEIGVNTTQRQTYTSYSLLFSAATTINHPSCSKKEIRQLPKYFLGKNQVLGDLGPGINVIIYSSFSTCSRCCSEGKGSEGGTHTRCQCRCFQHHGQFFQEPQAPQCPQYW